MKRISKACTSVLLGIGLLASAASADSVYRTGGNEHNGQLVNSYSNTGAEHYKYTMRSGGGSIYNLTPPPNLRPSSSKKLSDLKIPASVSYRKSHGKDLPSRYISHGNVRLDLSDVVEKHAKAYNLDPMLIEEVIRQESNFRPTVASHVGAQGLMQLMPGTAAMLGVRDSNDPDQNVEGGVRYLAQQLTRFGRLDYALAAYNAGPGAVESYGGIPPYAETQNYVARIVNAYNNRVAQARKNSKEKSED